MPPFIEMAFKKRAPKAAYEYRWRNLSSDTHFIFQSGFGEVRLQKRTAWPHSFAAQKDSRLYLGYGDLETAQKVIARSLKDISESVFYDEEFMLVVIDCQQQSVTIQRDALSTLPLFLYASADEFVASSQYERVFAQTPSSLPVNAFALATLLLGQLASGETLTEAIIQINDRQRFTWQAGRVNHMFPPHGSVASLTEESRQGDPRRFRKLLEETIERYWQRYGAGTTAGSELSCGFDSSAVNGYLALQGYHCYITSVSYHGTYQDSFLNRLHILSQRFDFNSHTIAMQPKEDFPLSPMAKTGDWHPFEPAYELYASSIIKQADYLRSKGVTVLFQGTGGNELFENIAHLDPADPLGAYFSKSSVVADYLTPSFHSFISRLLQQRTQKTPKPIPLLSNSVATIGNTTNNILIERGIWPVSPLSDARLYLYCQSLPIEYRMKRNIMRAYLIARGYPKETHTPTLNEDFGQFFDASVPSGLAPVFNALTEDAVLSRLGLVDMQAANAEWQQTARHGAATTATPIFTLYCLLVAEINLRYLDSSNLLGDK